MNLRPSRQVPNVGALWAILWRATILLACAVAIIVFAYRADWWQTGAALALYVCIAWAFARTSPERYEEPQEPKDLEIFL